VKGVTIVYPPFSKLLVNTDKKRSDIPPLPVFGLALVCGVAAGLFNNEVQPHEPTTSAAKTVTHTAKVNRFIFPPLRRIKQIR
jgi:hypothetical protein